MPHRLLLLGFLTLGLVIQASAQDISTPAVDVVDTYHGVTVHDPYRWLEDAGSPKVQAWVRAQNARSRAYLDGLATRPAIKARLTALISQGQPLFYGFKPRGERIFASLSDPAKQQPLLVALDAAADPASSKVVLDPNVLDASGSTTIDWWSPSPDGTIVAVSLSQQGSEVGALQVYETATGNGIGEPIPRV